MHIRKTIKENGFSKFRFEQDYDDIEGDIQSSITKSMQEVRRLVDSAPKKYKDDLVRYALSIFQMAADGDW